MVSPSLPFGQYHLYHLLILKEKFLQKVMRYTAFSIVSLNGGAQIGGAQMLKMKGLMLYRTVQQQQGCLLFFYNIYHTNGKDLIFMVPKEDYLKKGDGPLSIYIELFLEL
jgi:hypothetical protein